MEPVFPLDSSPDAKDLVMHLQAVAERERAALTRELHDDLGGLLVAAAMDIGFLEQSLPKDDPLRQQVARARKSIAAAIDLKRRLIEDLRPSMLDNFGLVEAIRWVVKQESARTGRPCSGSYPDPEPKFTQDAAIALFRIVEDMLGVALRQSKPVHLALGIDGDTLRIAISHEGESPERALGAEDALAICSAAYRAQAFGGRLTVASQAGGDTRYIAGLPLARVVSA